MPDYKPIRFKLSQYEQIDELRNMISAERNYDNLSLPDTVMEAIKVLREMVEERVS